MPERPDGRGKPGDPSTQTKDVEEGEALVKEAKKLVDAGGSAKKAYEKYCKGLQILLAVIDAIARNKEDDPGAADLRHRVDGYLEEAERLKQRLDTEGKSGGSERSREKDHALGKYSKSKNDGKASIHERIEKGEALISAGRDADARGVFDEAYEKYCRGLQYILEVMPQLNDKDPDLTPLRSKVSNYLERAEQLKEKLEHAGVKGLAEKPKDSSSKRASTGGSSVGTDRDRGARGRSRSRPKQKQRSQSRSRRHGGSARDHRRSGRSTSRSRRKEASRRSLAKDSSRRGSSPRPPPPKASGFGGLAGGGGPDEVDATRPKAPSGPRPPPGNQPLLRPKSGASLLVGKAKASARP